MMDDNIHAFYFTIQANAYYNASTSLTKYDKYHTDQRYGLPITLRFHANGFAFFTTIIMRN